MRKSNLGLNYLFEVAAGPKNSEILTCCPHFIGIRLGVEWEWLEILGVVARSLGRCSPGPAWSSVKCCGQVAKLS